MQKLCFSVPRNEAISRHILWKLPYESWYIRIAFLENRTSFDSMWVKSSNRCYSTKTSFGHCIGVSLSKPTAWEVLLNEIFCFNSRFFVTGNFQRHIANVYRISTSSVCIIIKQVCNAIITELRGELIELTEANWINISNEFNFKWQLPNCLGAIDGKHIAISKPAKSGSEYFNYKCFVSIVLMGVVDAR